MSVTHTLSHAYHLNCLIFPK